MPTWGGLWFGSNREMEEVKRTWSERRDSKTGRSQIKAVSRGQGHPHSSSLPCQKPGDGRLFLVCSLHPISRSLLIIRRISGVYLFCPHDQGLSSDLYQRASGL